jgi:hypothetical protein
MCALQPSLGNRTEIEDTRLAPLPQQSLHYDDNYQHDAAFCDDP